MEGTKWNNNFFRVANFTLASRRRGKRNVFHSPVSNCKVFPAEFPKRLRQKLFLIPATYSRRVGNEDGLTFAAVQSLKQINQFSSESIENI